MSNDISEALGGDFDAESIPIPSYEPIPPGWYAVEIDKAEVRDTKAGTGSTSLELVVLDEAHEGRRVFAQINLSNPNQQAVEIGQRELAALAMACGVPALRTLRNCCKSRLGSK